MNIALKHTQAQAFTNAHTQQHQQQWWKDDVCYLLQYKATVEKKYDS
jgi:hypothetical protein